MRKKLTKKRPKFLEENIPFFFISVAKKTKYYLPRMKIACEKPIPLSLIRSLYERTASMLFIFTAENDTWLWDDLPEIKRKEKCY